MARGRVGRSSGEYRRFNPHGHPCWHGCGRPATTRDHVPAIALHAHVEGSGCCELRPACAPCNARGGQAITTQLNRRRAILAAIDAGQRKRQRFGVLAEDTTSVH